MSRFELDAKDIEILEHTIQEYQQGAEGRITEYLHGKGYEILSNSIQNIIPVSNREKKHARNYKALRDRYKDSSLAVTVGSIPRFGYLYFPDDGSNTIHHAGQQHFFEQGINDEKENVINGILDAIKFNE